MGFLDFLGFGKQQKKVVAPPIERLENGELPWGWVTRNKEFCDSISREYSYFLNNWIDSRRKPTLEQYSALKSFVAYLEDAEKLCNSKGECFAFWFREILTGKGYVDKRKKDLEVLTATLRK